MKDSFHGSFTGLTLDTSLDKIEDLGFIVDREFNIVKINKHFRRFMGIKKGEKILGKKCYNVLHKTDRPIDNCPFQRSVESRKMEISDRFEASRDIHIQITSFPIMRNGEVNGSLHLLKDITIVKNSERTLKESERKFRFLFENATDMIFTFDINGIIADANRETLKTFGYDREEVIGKPIINFIHPDDRERILELMRDKFEKKESTPYQEYRVINSRKETFWICAKTSPIIKNGKMIGAQAIGRDVTERNRVYRRTKNFLDTLIDGVGDGILVLDMDYNIEMANTSFLESLGWEECNVIGRKCHEISHNNTEPCVEPHSCPFRKTAETKKMSQEVHEHMDSSGNTRFIEVITSPLIEDGQVKKIIEVQRDITDLKKKETELELLSKELLERQEELIMLTKELEEKNIDLEESNKLKQLFIDIMKHDLLNPAGVAKNYIEIIKEDNLGQENINEIEMAERNIKRLIEMIENASKLSRLSNFREIEKNEMDIIPMIEDTLGEFKSMADEKEIEIKYELNGPCIARINWIFKDVIENLLSNSIKYSPEGSRVRIDIQENENNLVLTIKDRGEGIPDDSKESVFERYQRLHKGSVKGTGLGLAIVKRIVTLHDGKVWVEDNLAGAGSIFFVEIPK